MKLTLRNTVPARDQSEIKKTNWIAHAEWKKCKSPKGRAQIDSLRPKKVPYSLCRDVMARACTESNQRSKGKLEAQLPFKIPPILHTSWTFLYMDGTAVNFFWCSAHMRRELGTQITPQGWIWFFINFKNSHQDLSNEGSNIILSSLKVGHWAAQTQPFFVKLRDITASYNNH